ncbi:uncharacterized protein LOC111613765, partial [Centruroides sculpturatus]|uniref:uncharacterized protein LOC111613765 n=1 Tax=Centruroides sculpturatus TaxID=218467 RepID=UPI000C6E06B3
MPFFGLRMFNTYICCMISFSFKVITKLLLLYLIIFGVFQMQTSFQDIRKFSECDLSLEQKLKILNFMKRFGKASLCLSIKGYFNVTKKFPVKMANALHSIFSGLLKLRSSTMQTSFQDIRKFSACDLSLEQKLK